MIYCQNPWYIPIALIALTSGFYAATLEEYYCGRLDLPLFNGVSDGCVVVYAIGLISGFANSGVWSAELLLGFSVSDVLLLAVVVCSAVGSVSK